MRTCFLYLGSSKTRKLFSEFFLGMYLLIFFFLLTIEVLGRSKTLASTEAAGTSVRHDFLSGPIKNCATVNGAQRRNH